jgi:hypothetical protein
VNPSAGGDVQPTFTFLPSFPPSLTAQKPLGDRAITFQKGKVVQLNEYINK